MEDVRDEILSRSPDVWEFGGEKEAACVRVHEWMEECGWEEDLRCGRGVV